MTGKSGILDAKNARGYAMCFRKDVEEKYAKRCAEFVFLKNGAVEALAILIKSENGHGGS